jgi:hypothetical protein
MEVGTDSTSDSACAGTTLLLTACVCVCVCVCVRACVRACAYVRMYQQRMPCNASTYHDCMSAEAVRVCRTRAKKDAEAGRFCRRVLCDLVVSGSKCCVLI